jgi:hypothetical protein
LTAPSRSWRIGPGLRWSVVVSLALLAGSVAAPIARADAGNTWTVAADNVQAPGYQTATLLLDGRVLATGGQGAKAELFDPTSGQWSAAASMNESRAYATATVLPDGRVLVAGGVSGSVVLASAELYDPAADSWTPTGSMATGRLQHSTALLPDGKVLVAGGNVAGSFYATPTATAEVYDPAKGEFTPTGAMTKPRAVFTATLLTDGTVLVADYGPTDVYDPASRQFMPTASLPRDIDSITAVRLGDGRVMAVGGARGATTAATIYDPAARTWQAAASLNWSRYLAPWGAVLLADGRLLIVGGSSYVKDAEIWDPATRFWTNTGALFNARSSNFGLVLLGDGRVLVDGGAVADVSCDNEGGGCMFGPTHPAEIYSP